MTHARLFISLFSMTQQLYFRGDRFMQGLTVLEVK